MKQRNVVFYSSGRASTDLRLRALFSAHYISVMQEFPSASRVPMVNAGGKFHVGEQEIAAYAKLGTLH